MEPLTNYNGHRPGGQFKYSLLFEPVYNRHLSTTTTPTKARPKLQIKITFPQRPVSQRLRDGVYTKQLLYCKKVTKLDLSLVSVLLIYLNSVRHVCATVNVVPQKKIGRCHITLLPSHNGHLSTTCTFLSS